MTLEELNQHAELRRELARAKAARASFEAAAEPGAQVLTGMPHAPGYRDKLGDLMPRIIEASRRVESLEEQLSQREQGVVSFINAIQDTLTWSIFMYRFLDGLTWGEVARAVGGNNTESSVKNICYRYLESCDAM